MSLELKKTQLELQRVQTARMELEYKVDEKIDEIERMKLHIIIQTDKEAELSAKISELKK